MQKKIISVVVLVFCAVICAVLCMDIHHKHYKHQNQSENNNNDENITYVMTPDGNWAKYAFYEKNDDYDPNEDYSEIVKNHFNDDIKTKYCYAHYAPHGDIWQIHCDDTNKLCQNKLDSEMADFMTVDTKKCYRAHLLDAWCISSVKTGLYRYYDDDSYGEILTHVCAKTESQCKKAKEFRFNEKSECIKQVVLSNKNEFNYIWSDAEIKKLIEQNKKSKPLVFRK